jgi:hypothetical protein
MTPAGALLGLAVGWAYSSRYVDALWLALAAGAVLLARGALRPRSPALWAAVARAVAGALPRFLLQWSTFGDPFTTAYARSGGVSADDFSLADIPSHAASVFLSPFFFGDRGTTQPLLSSMLVGLLAPLGLWAVWRRAGRQGRTIALGVAAASLAATVFYCAYRYTNSDGLAYGLLHFFKPWWPLWTVGGVVAIADAVTALARRPARAGP